MATSGTTSFTVTRDDIIQSALRGLSVLEEGTTPTTAAVTSAAFALNLILKNWQKDGIKLWTVTEVIVPYVASQSSYTIGPSGQNVTSDKPIRLVQAYLRNNQVSPPIDIPMQIISKQEYNTLGSKGSIGVTNSVMLDVNTTFSTVYVFLTPDSNTVTNYSLHLVVRRPIQDVNSATDNFDLPAEWFLPLKWGLMSELGTDYDTSLPRLSYIESRAEKLKKEVEDSDYEETSVMFVPDLRMNIGKPR